MSTSTSLQRWAGNVSAAAPARHEVPMDRYQIINCVSKGSYGAVYRAWDKKEDVMVAMKHEFQGFSPSTMRELEVLTSFRRHPSIVELRDVVHDEAEDRVFVVMEYFPCDLHRLTFARPKPCTMAELRRTMRQILEGVEFLHRNGVTHRDLKPANILCDRECRRFKICDFGTSRRLEGSGKHTPGNQVVTRWYMSPELLEGAERYTEAVDMWSVGCIMAELAVRKVLFPGSSEIDQLVRVRIAMETPRSSPLSLRRRLEAAASEADVPPLGPCGFDLLERLLEMNPARRITARDALRHFWFQTL